MNDWRCDLVRGDSFDLIDSFEITETRGVAMMKARDHFTAIYGDLEKAGYVVLVSLA